MAADDGTPNKSGRKPSKRLDVAPEGQMTMDGKKSQEIATAQLKLKNNSKNKIAFKILCNHPFVITVDRDIGFIEPGGIVSVTVTRIKFNGETYDQQGRRTFLLIQHVNVAPKADNPKKIWANVIGPVALKTKIPIKLIGDGGKVLGEGMPDDEKTEEG